jgi:hypothetical protein
MRNGPYELVKAPPEYPGFRYRGKYVYEHILVWWKNTGEVVSEESGFVVHHKNENRRDNAFSNLEKKERGAHTREHVRERQPSPAMTTLRCGWCDVKFQRLARVVKRHMAAGQTVFFCGRSHQVQAQQRDRSARINAAKA